MIIVENADTGKDMARFKGFASRPGMALPSPPYCSSTIVDNALIN